MTSYLIRKIETCPACQGSGFVQNLDWAEINRAHSEWMEARSIKTFTDEARANWEWRIKKRWPYGNPPPEEGECCECEGTGKIETWVSLQDALRAIGAL